MGLLITILLCLVNIFNVINNNSPSVKVGFCWIFISSALSSFPKNLGNVPFKTLRIYQNNKVIPEHDITAMHALAVRVSKFMKKDVVNI